MTRTRQEREEPEAEDTLCTRLKGYEGRPAATAGVGKDPVNEPMIRHWCEAVGDTNPAYTGPEAIAPPTMLQAWTMGGLSGHTSRSGAYEELLGLLDGAGYTSVVATDCEQEYLRPLRPGDRITFDALIESVSERKTTRLGTGHFVTTRMDVRVRGELAGRHRFRILKYAPAAVGRRATERLPAERRRVEGQPPERGQGQRGQGQGQEPGQVQEGNRGAAGRAAAEQAGRRPRPRPVVNRDNAGFWQGVAEHKLLIQRCAGCRKSRFPWLPGCNACGSQEWDTVEASGEGTVFSYVVMHHPPFPAFSASDEGGPYAVALIELAEGVRMVSNVIGVPYDKVRMGMPVRLEFLRTDPELALPVFRGGEG
ncbi:bifunctional MaoC family dehydratase N-terminal/OB-fold nucleic acid binding domain-containing protein [Streptomyces sp. NPDC052042]|uniref:bifunctional MaoC family dehydratase N-terminal/OB-fold nucleic acid binding domain-containing protein n=1 Tax=Streptomyces sp. NPDC052042 TaxID=3365683 RepID=UPI0037D4B476